MNNHPESQVVQMDSVIESRSGKLLLIIQFVVTNFKIFFSIILANNGSEYSNLQAIKSNTSGRRRPRLFYCNLCSPYQKVALRVNHTLIHCVLPKGNIFSHLTQNDILLMINHINSYTCKKLNDKSPIDTFSSYYEEESLSQLGSASVAPALINSTPKLFENI